MFSEAFEGLLVRRGHEVIATLTHPYELVALVQEQGDGFADVFVTELSFSELVGASVVSTVRACCPEIPMAILTSNSDVDTLRLALEAGADAVALKTDGCDEVESLLRFLASRTNGRIPSHAAKMWSKRARSLADRSTYSLSVNQPTTRELKVITLLTLGGTTSDIAGELGVSVATVRTHLQHIFMKLNVHSRIELMAYAVREGLVEGPSGSGRRAG
jgi:DNA-binding NarL/FixJ family response regulator